VGTPVPGALQSGTSTGSRPGSAGTPLPSGTAHVEMADVHQTVHQLRPHYDAYRQAFAGLFAHLTASIGAMPPTAHGFALSILQREFPALSGEEEFAAFARRAGVPMEPPKTAGAGGAGDSAPVRRLAQSLRPDEPPPRSSQEVDRFLSCVEDVLRASAKAFVELQKGQEQFGKEMGVRTIKEYTALHAAGTPENVLKYLLDWQVGGSHRTQELVGVYADLMIHQVALINGIMEGVRGLLARLAPQEIERGVTSGWPTRAAATWKRYIERHQEIAGEDKNITSVVFGPEFARAYAEVGGEGSGGR
jgi:type VI secretion system protein